MNSQDLASIKKALGDYEKFRKSHRGRAFAHDTIAHNAKRMLEVLDARQKVKEAIDSGDLKLLKKAIAYVEKAELQDSLLKPEYEQARKLRDELDYIERLKYAILNLDRATMSEIRNYEHPPTAVHDVMRASLLLLGDPELATKDWASCQKLCNTLRTPEYPGLLRRVQDYNQKFLHPEIAARVKEMLSEHTQEEVELVSHGAYVFFIWAVGMSDHCLSAVDEPPKPATGPRQKAILSEVAGKMAEAARQQQMAMQARQRKPAVKKKAKKKGDKSRSDVNINVSAKSGASSTDSSGASSSQPRLWWQLSGETITE